MIIKNKNKKIILFSLIFLMIFNISFFSKPQKTEAIWGVGDLTYDRANFVKNSLSAVSSTASATSQESLALKEYVLDPLAWVLKEVVIRSMVASTVQWINNGFQGNPAFVTDPDGYFSNLADGVIGTAIFNSNLKFLCSPFNLQVRLALTQQFTAGYQPQCRLSQIINNGKNSIEDLSNQWNWGTWYSITQNSNNNAFGSYIDASTQINDNINKTKKTEKTILDWGKGFLSYKKCTSVGKNGKKDCKIVTPGDTIADSLNSVLKIGNQNLVTADEMNEVVGALLGQLINKALGPNGLLSSSQSSNGQSSYLNQLKEEQLNLSNIVSKMISSLNSYLKNENDYLSVKQNSLDSVKNAKNGLESLEQCYSDKEAIALNNPPSYLVWNNEGVSLSSTTAALRIKTAQDKIKSSINTILKSLTSDVNSTSLNIDLLKGYKIKAKKAKNAQDLNNISQSVIDLQNNNSLHTLLDISNAKIQRDGSNLPGIIDQMNTINQKTVKEINECKSFLFKEDPNL